MFYTHTHTNTQRRNIHKKRPTRCSGWWLDFTKCPAYEVWISVRWVFSVWSAIQAPDPNSVVIRAGNNLQKAWWVWQYKTFNNCPYIYEIFSVFFFFIKSSNLGEIGGGTRPLMWLPGYGLEASWEPVSGLKSGTKSKSHICRQWPQMFSDRLRLVSSLVF